MTAGPVTRQIHLDFHTSAAIESVGQDFDPDQFADTMARAHVNSVNVFAKCAHGYSYYPTTVGTVHPGLRRDLLGEQIRALRARGIKAPAYLSVLWDDLAAIQHPEWVAVDASGRLLARPPLSADSALEHSSGWSALDLTSGYADYVADQVAEVYELYQPDGLWMDIVSIIPNYSPAGIEAMLAAGVDPSDQAAVELHYRTARQGFIERIAAIAHRYRPDATIVHNHTTDAWVGATIPAQNQIDVESLPTDGAWGYVHYPVYARYARTFGAPVVGMTGRFHRSWGDFGGLKTADQLTFEVGTILSAGGSPSIGDQLDPSGAIDPATYDTIGVALGRAEQLEPWLRGSWPLAEAAVVGQWNLTPADAGRLVKSPSRGTSGAAQMLLEQAVQFDVIDADRLRPGTYDLLVLPDDLQLDAAGADAVAACYAAGTAIISAGSAAVGQVEGAPCRVSGSARTKPAYLRLGTWAADVAQADADYAYVSYGGAVALSPAADAECFGQVVEARFNRSWDHWISHAQAPVGDGVAGPLVCLRNGWAHLAAPVFSDYAAESYWIDAAVVGAVIGRLLPGRIVSHDGPPWVEVTAHQMASDPATGQAGIAVHLTAFQPRRSTSPVPRIDRAADLVGFRIRVRLPGPVERVYLAPQGEPLEYKLADDGAIEILPQRLAAHTIIAIAYRE